MTYSFFKKCNKLLYPVSDFLHNLTQFICGTLCYSYDDQWTNRSADQQKINRHLFQWSINHNYSLLGMVFMSFSKYAKNKLHLKKFLKYG